VHGQANVIITNNKKDFPEECRNEYGILCQTADDFLIHQFYLSPALVFEKLDQQGATIRRTRAYIISTLEKPAPQFAKLLRSYLVVRFINTLTYYQLRQRPRWWHGIEVGGRCHAESKSL